MKFIKPILVIAAAAFFTFTMNAQTSTTTSSAKAPVKFSATNPQKPTPGDKVNNDLKGTGGETVYTASTGTNYFISKKTGLKVMIADKHK